MKILELFCGTKSISKAFEARGHEVYTVDFDDRFKPDMCIDIMEFSPAHLPREFACPDVIWASPPCQTFSVSSIGHYWKDGCPKNSKAIIGRAILYKTLWLIEKLQPKLWFIENPRGMMRKDGLLIYLENYGGIRRTVTYCQYGEDRMKPTDIWTNCKDWIPKPMCKPGADCHESQPRGYQAKKDTGAIGKGTQGMKNAMERSRIPEDLCNEIVESCVNSRKHRKVK